MKYILVLCALFLTACNCQQVVDQEKIVDKQTSPATIGICLANKVGDITTYIPLHGGICSGSIEVIPEKWFVITEIDMYRVSEKEYESLEPGDYYPVVRMDCSK